MKSYRAWSPDQPYLLPPSPREWLPAGHLAFFILDLVRDLDLGAIEAELQAKESRGERPYSPVMMTGLLLYAYATGVFSSRGIERATVEDVAFRFLAASERPHFTTINQFRARHQKALAELFTQVLQACMSAGLVKLGHVALDGTKMKANASKHKAMSYDRLVADDAKLRAEVEALLERAEAVDAEEDEQEGTYDPQEEIRRREERLAKMQEAREALRRERALPSHQANPERVAMRTFLESPEGHALYARRKATVEPVIGQIRTRGFQQLSFRGLFKNRCEWLFVAATHNLLKLWRAARKTQLVAG